MATPVLSIPLPEPDHLRAIRVLAQFPHLDWGRDEERCSPFEVPYVFADLALASGEIGTAYAFADGRWSIWGDDGQVVSGQVCSSSVDTEPAQQAVEQWAREDNEDYMPKRFCVNTDKVIGHAIAVH